MAASVTTALPIIAQPAPAAAAAGEVVEVEDFGSNPGNLKMSSYIPVGLPPNAPVVVVLHGCFTGPGSYDDETGWTRFADAWGVALVFPDQKITNALTMCFNWIDDQTRGEGEPLSIKQMVDWTNANHGTDPNQAYIMGHSGGGHMTTVMLATYPDVFKAGAVLAGGPFKCGPDRDSCTSGSVDRTPAEWGALARSGFPGYTGPKPRLSVWQGSLDPIVSPRAQRELVEQWTSFHGIDQTPDVSDIVKGYTHQVYNDAGGAALVESWLLQGRGHPWPSDPEGGVDGCEAGNAAEDQRICAAFYAGRWFGINPAAPPRSATFSNVETEAGFVTAHLTGGSREVGDSGSVGHGIGRTSLLRYGRTVLSFNTASLPDGAVIDRAYLRFERRSSTGKPWWDPPGNTLFADVRTGCFGRCAIEPSDWDAAPTASEVASTPNFSSDDFGWSESFDAAGRSSINLRGSTQVKLRFRYPQSGLNRIYLETGGTAKLIIEYH